MRRPKSPGAKKAPPEREIAGGRAWARVQQQALARGLVVKPPASGRPAKPKSRAGPKPSSKKPRSSK
jgi:hypothetical protein